MLWKDPPTPADYDKNGAPLPLFDPSEADQTQTLQSLCERGADASKTAPPYAVEPELQAKRILVVAPNKNGAGTDKMRETIFRAAGRLYGLRVLGKEGGTLQMTRVRVATPTKLSGLSDAVLATLPNALLRAYYGAMPAAQAQALARHMKDHEDEPGFDPKKPPEYIVRFAQDDARDGAADALQATALHRFRVLLTPRLGDGKTVSAENLTEEEKRLMALALTTNTLNDMERLNKHPSPPTPVGVEQGVISWGWNGWDKTKPHFDFMLNTRNEADPKEWGNYRIGYVAFPAPKASAPK